MSLFKKILLYYKDFFYQVTIMFLIICSPLGNPFDYYKYSKETYVFTGIADFFVSVSLMYCYTALYFFFPILFNIYFVRFNKFRLGNEDYIAMKILLLFSVNFFYLMIWMKLYTPLIYRDFLMPLLINLIGYLVYIWIEKKRNFVK